MPKQAKSKKQKEEDQDYQKELYSVYLEERNNLIIAHREQSSSFDKNMLYVGAGALGLSLTFIKDFGSIIKETVIWILLGWSGLTLTITAVVVAIFLSQYACMHQMKQHDKNFFNDSCGGTVNPFSKAIIVLNIASIALLIASIACIVCFVVLNFSRVDGVSL